MAAPALAFGALELELATIRFHIEEVTEEDNGEVWSPRTLLKRRFNELLLADDDRDLMLSSDSDESL